MTMKYGSQSKGCSDVTFRYVFFGMFSSKVHFTVLYRTVIIKILAP